jgi:hypothetical protein
MLDQELWVVDKFVNSRWFRNKFQLKVHWEDHEEDQDEWRDHDKLMAEVAGWREELAVEDLPDEDPIVHLRDEYYARHPGAPRHDDPPYRRAAPPRVRGVH